MSEQPELPRNYSAVFDGMVEPLEFSLPSTGELLRDARKTARHMSEEFMIELDELGAGPFDHNFYDVPLADGSLRVAITPSDPVYSSMGSPVWRLVINRGSTLFQHGKPKEQWVMTDAIIQPNDLRLGVRTSRLLYTFGYGEIGPPPGHPPRIIRDVNTSQYSLSQSEGYMFTLPEVPVSRKTRLGYYQNFSTILGSFLEVFKLLSGTTKVEASPDLAQDEDP